MSEVEVAVKKQNISPIRVDQQKLYYIHYDIVDKYFTPEYTIYCLDLSHSDGNAVPIPSPLITLERNKYASEIGFGAVGSKIYMVGGVKCEVIVNDRTKSESVNWEPSFDVYIFDTSLPVPSLTSGPPLNAPKRGKPIVITIQGKLYVMPHIPKCEKDGSRSVMEVLDPIVNSWSIVEFPSKMWDIPYKKGLAGPFEIIAYGVSGSKILLSLKLSLNNEFGIVVYNTETDEWVIRQFTPKLKVLPLNLGSRCLTCDVDDIWYATFAPYGVLAFQDITLINDSYRNLDYEEHGDIDLRLSELSCSHPKPFMEDARVLELSAPGFVLVVSRCWMKPMESWFEVRLHVLKLNFERSGMYSKARIRECQVIKCMSFMRPLVTDDPKKTLSLKGMTVMRPMPMDFCFLI